MTEQEIEAACWAHIQQAENWMTPELSDGYNENEVYRAWKAGYKAAQEEYELDAERWKTFIAITDKKNK